jgi:hypothetical protein
VQATLYSFLLMGFILLPVSFSPMFQRLGKVANVSFPDNVLSISSITSSIGKLIPLFNIDLFDGSRAILGAIITLCLCYAS